MVKLFGLDGNPPRTLNEVGKELGVCRELIRQTKERTILKLRKKMKLLIREDNK